MLSVLDALALLLFRPFGAILFTTVVAKAPGEGKERPCAVGDPLPVQQQGIAFP